MDKVAENGGRRRCEDSSNWQPFDSEYMPNRNLKAGCVVVGVGTLLLFAWFVVLPIARMLHAGHRHTTVRESTRFKIADTSYELVHSRIGIHPMMAEYERDITYIDGLTNGTEERYIGCLTGGLDRLRFVPASESPERPIKHLFP